MSNCKRTASRVALLVLVLSTGLSTFSTAWGYVFSRTSQGALLRWPAPAHPVFYANNSNISGLTSTDIFSAFTHALQRWKFAGSVNGVGAANIDFTYYQSPSNPHSSACDTNDVIFFTSQSTEKLAPGVIGVTYVCGDASTGEIVGADVLFNDEDFTFTTNVSDSSQFPSGSPTKVFLENVATHEFGHSYGLGHSAVLQSTMVFAEDRGQAKPSCDDIQGMAAAYPRASFVSGRGGISGAVNITDPAYVGAPTNIFGAHVQAISKTRGTTVASVITEATGFFSIPDLEPGDYYLLVEPFQAGSSDDALCGGSPPPVSCTYGSFNSKNICSGSPFKRMFLESSAGHPNLVAVSAGNSTSVGTISVGCSAMSEPFAGSAFVRTTAPLLVNGAGTTERSGVLRGVAGGSGSRQWFKLSQVAGNLVVRAIAYSLYSPFNPSVDIVDSSGATIAGVVQTGNVFTNSSSFVNYDASASLADAPVGDYYAVVTVATDLSGVGARGLYPAGYVAGQIDPVPYFLVTATVNDSTTLLPVTNTPALANNARCESTSEPATYTQPSSSSSSGGGSSGDSGGHGLFGCGVLHHMGTNHNDQPPAPPGASEFAFSGWGLLGLLWAFHSMRSRLASSRQGR